MSNSENDPSCECIKGTIHKGQPIGAEETIHGLNTYVVGNRTSPRAIIVMYSDIFGLLLPNNKLIADSYAESGEYLVYMPDFFQGDSAPLKLADLLIPVDKTKQSSLALYSGLLINAPTFLMWQSRHSVAGHNKISTAFLEALRRATPRTQKIGIVGFCWGGKYAVRAGLDSNIIEMDGAKVPLVDAVVALHPSHLAVPEDVEKIVVPASFAWGEKDTFVKVKQKADVEEVHSKAKDSGTQVPEVEHRVYKAGRHGFAVRGNPDDPGERECLEGSVEQVLTWFGRFL